LTASFVAFSGFFCKELPELGARVLEEWRLIVDRSSRIWARSDGRTVRQPARLVQHGQVGLVDRLVALNRYGPVAGHSSGAKVPAPEWPEMLSSRGPKAGPSKWREADAVGN
jgi:hypothetical protein